MFQSLFFWIHFYNLWGFAEGVFDTEFQSLFFWIHFYNLEPSRRGAPISRFQSLFFWIHFYNHLDCADPLASYHVSILVFLDSLLQLKMAEEAALCAQVSILVFLDSLLQLVNRATWARALLLFQSLFFWIHFYNRCKLLSSSAPIIQFQSLFFWIHFYNLWGFAEGVFDTEFQSLFFWIHFYNLEPSRRGAPISRFQSLFFWIHFYNHLDCADPLASYHVSILVFLDSLLQLKMAEEAALCAQVSILVFLDSLLQLVNRATWARALLLFQSLFFWIHFYNRCKLLSSSAPIIQFQSLFFWIHFYNTIGLR